MEDRVSIPEDYVQSLKAHFSEDVVSRVLAGLREKPSVSIRLNPRKPGAAATHKNSSPVPWHNRGLLFDERPHFHHDPVFHAGAYYVQDSSSMMLAQFVRHAQLPEQNVVLDFCAAPGGKSTLILDEIGPSGFLVANEIDQKRNAILSENLLKWGRPNHAITKLSSEKLADCHPLFDLVVVDAPCSGEGMFRKDNYAIQQWSNGLVQTCSTIQQEILNDLQSVIRSDGHIIYSTCTMNRSENENNILHLLENGFELDLPDLSSYENYIVPAIHEGEVLGYYLLPGISTGEGLFISMLRKVTDADDKRKSKRHKSISSLVKPIPDHIKSTFDLPMSLSEYELNGVHWGVTNPPDLTIPVKSLGLPLYSVKGKHVIPEHGLAMLTNLSGIELDREQALKYLKKETIKIPSDYAKGWHQVSFEGVSLGWIKNIGNRVNNYYPNWLRIKN